MFASTYRSRSRWYRRRVFSTTIYILRSRLLTENHLLTVQVIGHLARNKEASRLIPPLYALQRIDHPWLVTINLSHENHDRLINSKSGFRRALQQRINNWLPRIGAEHFLFVLEQKKDRWHLHGLVAYPIDQREKLRQALKGIAGDTPSPFMSGRLVHLQGPDDSRSFRDHNGLSGWGLYLGKDLSKSSAALQASPVIASRPLKALLNEKSDRTPRKVARSVAVASDPQWDNPEWARF